MSVVCTKNLWACDRQKKHRCWSTIVSRAPQRIYFLGSVQKKIPQKEPNTQAQKRGYDTCPLRLSRYASSNFINTAAARQAGHAPHASRTFQCAKPFLSLPSFRPPSDHVDVCSLPPAPYLVCIPFAASLATSSGGEVPPSWRTPPSSSTRPAPSARGPGRGPRPRAWLAC